MKRSWLVLVLCLSLGVNLGILGTLAAGRWNRDKPPRERAVPQFEDAARQAHRRLDRLAEALDLVGEDRERFIALQRRLFEESFERRLRRRELDRELRRELTAAQPDRARVEGLIRELAEGFVASETVTAEIILESRLLLGPEKERAYLKLLGRIRSQGQRPWQRRGAVREQKMTPP
ncbi:MAG: hypothetical protein AAF604_20840 [Acidobacteriota bacterium]